jgi:hypothetical protein
MRRQGVGRDLRIFLYQWHRDATDVIGDARVLWRHKICWFEQHSAPLLINGELGCCHTSTSVCSKLSDHDAHVTHPKESDCPASCTIGEMC